MHTLYTHIDTQHTHTHASRNMYMYIPLDAEYLAGKATRSNYATCMRVYYKYYVCMKRDVIMCVCRERERERANIPCWLLPL